MYKLTKNAGAVTINIEDTDGSASYFLFSFWKTIFLKVSLNKVILVYSCRRRKYQYNEGYFRFKF